MNAADLAQSLRGKPAGDGWLAKCPAHQDDRASLSIGSGQQGRVLLHCHAGCTLDAITSAAGITKTDLFAEHTASAGTTKPRIVAAYRYLDESSAHLYDSVRLEPKDFRLRKPDGAEGYTWNVNGVRRIVYRLNELAGKQAVFVVEGQKDVDRLHELKIPATCNAGGALKWRDEFSSQIASQGVRRVVVVPDNDDPGREHAAQVARSCHAAGLQVKVLELPDLPEKGDVSDFLATHSKDDLIALAKNATAYTPATAHPALTSDSAPQSVPVSPYTFGSAFPVSHFVGAYTEYATQRTDAALEYHEALAIALIAAATPNLRANIGPYPNGIGTNLYLTLLGESTVSRKSSASDAAKDIHERALPGALLPDAQTPEALIETLAKRPRQSSTLYVDEFAELFTKIEKQQYMAGLKPLLLTLYAGNSYTAQRRSKGSGGQKTEDSDVIERPHLCLICAATPMLFHRLNAEDVLNGLMPRFAIVWPQSKPPRRPFYEVGEHVESRRSDLVDWLRNIHAWASKTERQARFDREALELIDGFAARLERDAARNGDEHARIMLQRLMPMCLKLAMCAAAGRIDTLSQHTLLVTPEDAHAALLVAERWSAYARAFAARIGQTDFERRIEKCLEALTGRGGRTARRNIARQAHVTKRELDAIEETLTDRGLIQVEQEPAASGPATKIWTLARTEA